MNKAAELPRVTYSNTHADFTPLHDALDVSLPAFQAALGKAYPNVIGGRADDDGKVYGAETPVDDRIALGSFVDASPAAIARAVAAARATYPAWSARPWRERVAVMRRAADILSARKRDVGAACLFEVGKSRMESMGEAEECLDLIGYYCDEMEKNAGYVMPMRRAFEREETRSVLRAVGVFGVIAPFNFPVALSTNMIAAALLAGNTIVYKPSPRAGVTASFLVGALHEAGVPAGAVNVVCGEHAGQVLVDTPGLDGIAFTGSHAVGMEIYRKFAAGAYARPVVVEMGGKNPAYVTASADLDVAAEGVTRSAFGLQGQKCSACSVVYVHRSVHQEFVGRLVEKTGRLNVGNPIERDVFMGPVINHEAYERFVEVARAARAAGRIIAGGERLSGGLFDHGYYIQPTIVDGLPADHRLNRDEVFLPFVSVQPFADLGEAIRRGNAVLYGLTAGLYAETESEIELFLTTAEAGALYVNRRSGATTGAWPGIQSFCGWKGSGVSGKGGLGPYYLPQFMRDQSHTIMRGT